MNLEPQPGAVIETVVVTGTVPILQIDRADACARIETKQLKEL